MDSHFFDDLGANSLLMAKFSALVRKETALPSLSMREIYRQPHHPPARRARSGRRRPGDGRRAGPDRDRWCATSSAGYLAFGAAQLLSLLGTVLLGAWSC